MINLRLAQPDMVVDISRLTELHGVVDTGSHISVGGCTPHADFEDGVVPDFSNGLLCAVASGIAYRAIRNRGTIGGSLAHADSAAEWPSVMMALAARVVIHGSAGSRVVEMNEFIQGPMTTVLTDEEIIVAVEIPRASAAMQWGFDKRARKVGEFAHSLAVVVHEPEKSRCSVVMGATGGAPLQLHRTAAVLAEAKGWKEGFEREVRSAYETDIDEVHLNLDEYDRHVHGLAVIRAAKEAIA
jgi:carbon-monoxide dehydrogenase medium subunit